VDVLGRFLNMGVEPYNFVSALNCILAQRLVRTVCEFCVRESLYRAELELNGPRPKDAGFRLPRGPPAAMECGGTAFVGCSPSTSCWS